MWGIYGVYFIWHGAWADPEISYRGHTVNYYDVENAVYEDYKEFCSENGLKPSDDEFCQYAKRNAGSVKEYIKNLL